MTIVPWGRGVQDPITIRHVETLERRVRMLEGALTELQEAVEAVVGSCRDVERVRAALQRGRVVMGYLGKSKEGDG